MASGGIYDHLGGGFARYSVDQVAGAPLREDAVRPGAAGPGLPARLAGHRATSATGRCSTRPSATCCATCATRTGLLLGRGRRQRGRGGPVLRLDPRRGRGGARRRSRPGRRGHGLLRRDAEAATSRAAPSSTASRDRGELARPPRDRGAPARLFAARERRVRPGLDDKVADRVERADAGRAGRGGRGHRAGDWLAAAVATASSCCASCAATTAAGCGRGRPTAAPATSAYAADHAALVDAFVRLAEATGEARWIDAARSAADALARPVLGRRARRRVHHRRATPSGSSPAPRT